ncbi:MAG: iron-containing alcohol dehydrogenase [Alphaproteobacteria bacterium]
MTTASPLKTGRFDLLDQKTVVFGKPAVEVVAAEIAARGVKRLLVGTTHSSTQRALDIVQVVEAGLTVQVAKRLVAHTPTHSVFGLAEELAEFKPDMLLVVGGGSAIDACKIASFMVAEGITTREELIARSMQKGGAPGKANSGAMRYIAVPTTLSGAEFGTIGGSVDNFTSVKFGYAAPYFPAEMVIFDPVVASFTPDWLWLSSGIRAVDHAVEALLSPDANPFIDGAALHALTLLSRSLMATKRDPADLAARQESQFGVWLAAQSVGRVRYGASHGIGHQLGAVGGVPHGHTSCVMLPAVMRWNAAVTGPQQALIHRVLDPSAPDAATAVANLIAALGLPTTLKEVGIREPQFMTIAELAMANPFVKANPRPITSPGDIIEIMNLVKG